MRTVYYQLAQVLDRLPNGCPATQSGAELKIPEHLFTPEESYVYKTIALAFGWAVKNKLNRSEIFRVPIRSMG